MTDDVTLRTFRSFGYEWTAFDGIRPEDEHFWRQYVADVPLKELASRRALDAGCGKGRYTVFSARHVGFMIGLDGSAAAGVAARNLAEAPNCAVLQADLRRPPFPPAAFGFIQCLGVLHHLPEPEAGFANLVELLAPGGVMLIYVYSRPTTRGTRSAMLRLARALRRLTTRMPHRLLRILSAPIGAALYATVVAPGRIGDQRGLRRLSALPLGTYRGRPVRSLWLDTFDRLSAPVEHRYTEDELRGWFSRNGLVLEGIRESGGLYAVGRKPG